VPGRENHRVQARGKQKPAMPEQSKSAVVIAVDWPAQHCWLQGEQLEHCHRH